jgi:predicted AAA+ superfamily ATPase
LWGDHLDVFVEQYQQKGVGLFGQYQAFCWQQGQLQPVAHPDGIHLQDLVGYDGPQKALCQNTECLLRGLPALNVLLYGSRGSGKSSLVKALLNHYGDRGLRLIEVSLDNLTSLPVLVESLRDQPQKFIIFVDDLSFEEDDQRFKQLKVVLEGNVVARPNNVVIYATSNRRHLIREFFGDRPAPQDGEEVQAWDTVQEKLSFRDRFGLTLTFLPANQETYLQIVHHLAQRAGLTISLTDLDFRAKQWATQHNGRSGRSARQFVDYLIGEEHLSKPGQGSPSN